MSISASVRHSCTKLIHGTIGVLLTAILFFSGAGANASILLNPSFEDPDVPNTGYTDVNPTSWTSTEPVAFQVSLFDRPDFPAVDGDQFLAFNAATTPAGASIHQSFSTIVGATYDVSFWSAANIPSISSVIASVFDGDGLGGTSLASQNSILAAASLTFAQTTFSFAALSTTTTLAFFDNSPQTLSSDLFLDHVEIKQTSFVPEPSSMTVFVLIGCAFGLLRRLR